MGDRFVGVRVHRAVVSPSYCMKSDNHTFPKVWDVLKVRFLTVITNVVSPLNMLCLS